MIDLKNIGIPSCCPVCGGALEIRTSKDGVKNLFCVNDNCASRYNETLATFLERLGVMGVSNDTLTNWNLKTVKDIVDFKPNPKYKNEVKFAEEMDKKLWNRTKKDIFIAMSAFMYGVGRKESEKFWDKFSGPEFLGEHWGVAGGFSVKEKTILDNLPKVRGYCDTIFADSRYNEPQVVETTKPESTKGTICFTGKLETMTRSEAQAKAKKLGYEIADGVSKNLGTLVVADAGLKGAPSSKLKKAMSLGVKIMGESEFAAL